MTPTDAPVRQSRKDQILECLAAMLEESPGDRITTARLAARVGVSEAALYRHFPSKAKMFEALIEFIEDTIFTRVSRILQEDLRCDLRCKRTLSLLLTFVERNPGITRLLTGDALAGESARLRTRVAQFYDRYETQLRQILREAEIRENVVTHAELNVTANLLMAAVEGRISQFVRSDFSRKPTEHWEEQWRLLAPATMTRSVTNQTQ